MDIDHVGSNVDRLKLDVANLALLHHALKL